MELFEAMLNRRSIRDYNDKEIPDDILHSILEAGLLSPSSRNLYPSELIMVKDRDMIRQLARAKTADSGMLKNAACAIVVESMLYFLLLHSIAANKIKTIILLKNLL